MIPEAWDGSLSNPWRGEELNTASVVPSWLLDGKVAHQPPERGERRPNLVRRRYVRMLNLVQCCYRGSSIIIIRDSRLERVEILDSGTRPLGRELGRLDQSSYRRRDPRVTWL